MEMHCVVEAESADEAARIVAARDRFWKAYAKERGWPLDPVKLSIDQILEIRKQPGWKDPLAKPN